MHPKFYMFVSVYTSIMYNVWKCVSYLHIGIYMCKIYIFYVLYLKYILIQKVTFVQVSCAPNELPVSA